jgi:hypothetical protein
MQPDPAPPLEPSEEPPRPAASPVRRQVGLVLAFLAPCVVLALSIASMVRDSERQRQNTPSAAPLVASAPAPAAASAGPPRAEGDPQADVEPNESPEFFDETDDGEPNTKRDAKPKHYASVQQAAGESCSTSSVAGLSQQIIEQMRCLKPKAFVPLPSRDNLVVASNVFPYLRRETRDHLLRALTAQPKKKMTINSALRTLPQQYLVSRWAAGQRCGVQLANRPGDSNHELGSALDIAEPTEWRTALEAEGFRWLGQADRVHFDFKGAGASTEGPQDVLAFQVLWNRNHQTDRIEANGRYSPATEQRLKQAPPSGFPLGPQCGKAERP